MLYNDSIPDSDLFEPHAEIKPVLEKNGVPENPTPTRSNLSRIRKGYALANARFNNSKLARNVLGCVKPDDPSSRYWSESDHQFPVRDGNKIPVRIYRPKSLPASGVPVVVLMHGGGWVMGDLDTDATLARIFCAKLGLLVVNVGFRNYPEVAFGVPTLDCYDAVRWTAANAKSYGGNCEIGFILAGISGGGAYASISAHFARDEGLTPRVTGQWLTCPVLGTETGNRKTGHIWNMFDLKTDNRSYEQNKDAPLMNRKMSDAITKFADFDFTSTLLTPFLFKDHKDLGRGGVYVQVTGLDPWRDPGRIYQGLCEKDGNRTKLQVYSGLPHCWWTAFPMFKVSAQWAEDCVSGMLWLLQRGLQASTAKL